MLAKVKDDPAGTLQDCVIFPNKNGPALFFNEKGISYKQLANLFFDLSLIKTVSQIFSSRSKQCNFGWFVELA